MLLNLDKYALVRPFGFIFLHFTIEQIIGVFLRRANFLYILIPDVCKDNLEPDNITLQRRNCYSEHIGCEMKRLFCDMFFTGECLWILKYYR